MQLQRGERLGFICAEEERSRPWQLFWLGLSFSSFPFIRSVRGRNRQLRSNSVSRTGSRGTCQVRHTTYNPGKTEPSMVLYRVRLSRSATQEIPASKAAQSRPGSYNVSPPNSSAASNALQRQLYRQQAHGAYIRTAQMHALLDLWEGASPSLWMLAWHTLHDLTLPLALTCQSHAEH